jgi:hypothetical protein
MDRMSPSPILMSRDAASFMRQANRDNSRWRALSQTSLCRAASASTRSPMLRSLCAFFRACPVPEQSGPRRLASDQFYNLVAARIPWSQGKMQGISLIQPFLRENLSRKHLRIQPFAREFPTRRRRELFCASRESIRPLARSREFGAKSIRGKRISIVAPTRPFSTRQCRRSAADQAEPNPMKLRAAGGGRQGLAFEATFTIGAELAGDGDASQL